MLLNQVKPTQARRTEVWVYLNGEDFADSPYNSIVEASADLKNFWSSATRATIANNIDSGEAIANGLEFWSGPKPKR